MSIISHWLSLIMMILVRLSFMSVVKFYTSVLYLVPFHLNCVIIELISEDVLAYDAIVCSPAVMSSFLWLAGPSFGTLSYDTAPD